MSDPINEHCSPPADALPPAQQIDAALARLLRAFERMLPHHPQRMANAQLYADVVTLRASVHALADLMAQAGIPKERFALMQAAYLNAAAKSHEDLAHKIVVPQANRRG